MHAQQAGIYKDIYQPVANGTMHQNRGDGGIHDQRNAASQILIGLIGKDIAMLAP